MIHHDPSHFGCLDGSFRAMRALDTSTASRAKSARVRIPSVLDDVSSWRPVLPVRESFAKQHQEVPTLNLWSLDVIRHFLTL